MAYSHRRFLRIIISFIAILFCALAVSQKVQAASGSVNIPVIVLSKYQVSANVGDEFYIAAITSNGAFPTWKSSKSSVAKVDNFGVVTAIISGTAIITAKADGVKKTCAITVKEKK